ncbi:hypothetical protein HDV00_001091 [Rhizophlyctis rosea]|nr:hypothetical protein HDV00_001091 [Rhizophlyctis rosea]
MTPATTSPFRDASPTSGDTENPFTSPRQDRITVSSLQRMLALSGKLGQLSMSEKDSEAGGGTEIPKSRKPVHPPPPAQVCHGARLPNLLDFARSAGYAPEAGALEKEAAMDLANANSMIVSNGGSHGSKRKEASEDVNERSDSESEGGTDEDEAEDMEEPGEVTDEDVAIDAPGRTAGTGTMAARGMMSHPAHHGFPEDVGDAVAEGKLIGHKVGEQGNAAGTKLDDTFDERMEGWE